jgi:hypothetical protein
MYANSLFKTVNVSHKNSFNNFLVFASPWESEVELVSLVRFGLEGLPVRQQNLVCQILTNSSIQIRKFVF